jgi:hypothetical protein
MPLSPHARRCAVDIAADMAMTREVREGVAGIQKAQSRTAGTLDRLKRASESLAITTDYWCPSPTKADPPAAADRSRSGRPNVTTLTN